MSELAAEPPEPPEPPGALDGPRALDLPGALRALRRRADVSQRELAGRSGVPVSTVGRIEAGTSPDPRLRTVERLARAAGARLAIVDIDGAEPTGLATDRWRDKAERRFPAHLDPSPQNRWRRGAAEDVISFYRNRWLRDVSRRDRSGERSWDLFTEIRRLGPGDRPVLAGLCADAGELGFTRRPVPSGRPPDDQEALRYLRDPSVRHWIAEPRPPKPGGRVFGHLIARLHRSYAGPPAMVVTEFGLRPEHRAGPLGPMLVAALCDEADRCGVGELVVLTRDRGAAHYLRGLGFARRPRRLVLLRAPD
ncbi:MAG: GNAT family N-acetyltransferase [Micromonosporaceae bacterium]|nr:GNAT family N-acetyltransferase [Micromonosporaceae bacterium]